MVRSCRVLLAAALTGFRAICALRRSRGYAVCWRDCLGATVYDKAGRTSHWGRARDEDVLIQSKGAAWDVAITWSRRMWARAPQPWHAREGAALMAGYLRAIADWAVLQPPSRWTCLMRAGGSRWPVGLSRPLADAHTVLRYAMGESACVAAGPPYKLVGRAVPVSMLDPAERGACPDVVVGVGTPSSLQGATPEVVVATPATLRALFPGFTLQPLGDGPLVAFQAGAAPPGVLAVLQAFFAVEAVPPGTNQGRARVPSPKPVTPTWARSSMSTSSASPPAPLHRPPPVSTRHQRAPVGPNFSHHKARVRAVGWTQFGDP